MAANFRPEDIQRRLQASISQLPPVTQALTGVSIFFTLLGWLLGSRANIDGFRPYLAASGYTLPPSFFLWTLATAGLFEENLISLITNLVLLVLAARYLEQVWGSTELLKFVIVVNVVAAGITVIAQVFSYAITFEPTLLYGTQVNGHVALLLAIIVAFKQLVPEHAIQGVPFRLRTKDLPIIFLALAIVRYLIFGQFFMAIYAFSGFYAGWGYLRFFQVRDGIKGDRSETFAFAMLFPEPLQPMIRGASTFVFRILVLMRLCARVEPRTSHEIEMEEAIYVRKDAPSVLGAEQLDAERRRQKALQALESRLAARPATPAITESPQHNNYSGVQTGFDSDSGSKGNAESNAAVLHGTVEETKS